MFDSGHGREKDEILNDCAFYWVVPYCTPYRTCMFAFQVDSHHLDKMHAAYGSLLKSAMTTLRKRDKKREKERAEKFARRKRRLAEPVVIEGPKRGSGRRKRQRRIKAALKQQEQKKRAKEREAESRRRVKTHDS
jgi:signal recognition particle subunit SRP14